jgi:predicted DNA-binding antitoxin AbrB/MazE fold protein
MYAIKAIYDGSHFKPQEPVPVEGKYEVVITFTKPINTSQEELYKLIQEGIDDIEDGKTLTENEILKNMETALGK